MSKIKQYLLNNSDSQYRVYIFKIRIKGTFKYTIGSCEGDPLDILQGILRELHKELNYLCQAKVLVSDKIAPDSCVSFDLQEEELLYRSRSHFSKKFSKIADLYVIDQDTLLALYYSYVPDTRGLKLVETMPAWSMNEVELASLRTRAVEISKEYYLIKG